MADLVNLLALLRGEADTIQRLVLAQPAQQVVTDLFATQAAEFLSGEPEIVPFDASYSTDESEIFRIQHFELPEPLVAAAQNPLSLEELDPGSTDAARIKGIIGIEPQPGGSVLFQVFDRRRVLSPERLSLIHSQATFKVLSERGMTLDTELAAVWRGGELFFRSLPMARRVLDLSVVFREATDADLSSLAAVPVLLVADELALLAIADTWVRRKVSLILQSGILEGLRPQRLKSLAAKYRLSVTTAKKGGKLAIVLPVEKKQLKDLLRFLDEDYFTSEISNTKYLTNSKRPAT